MRGRCLSVVETKSLALCKWLYCMPLREEGCCFLRYGGKVSQGNKTDALLFLLQLVIMGLATANVCTKCAVCKSDTVAVQA